MKNLFYQYIENRIVLPARVWNLLLVGIANSAVIVVSLITTLMLARLLELEQYGKVIYFISLVGSMRVLMAFGLGTKITKDVSERLSQPKSFQDHYWSLLTFRIITIMIAGIVVIIIRYSLNIDFLIIAWFAASLAIISDFNLATLGGLQLIIGINTVLLSQPLVYLVIVLMAVVISPNSLLIGTIWGFVISFGFSLIVGLTYVIRSKTIKVIPRVLSPRYIRDSLKFIGGVYLLALLGSFYSSIVGLVLGAQSKYNLVSLIGIPINLVFLPATIINVAIITVVYPELCKYTGVEQEYEFIETLDTYARYISVAILLYIVVLVSFPSEIITLIYSSKFISSYPMVFYVAPTALLDLLGTLLMYALISRGRTTDAVVVKFLQFITLIAGIFIVTGMPLEIDMYEKWIGVCYTASALIGFLSMWVKLAKIIQVQIKFKSIFLSIWIFAFIFCFYIYFRTFLKSPIFLISTILLGSTFIGLFIVLSGFLQGKHRWLVTQHD